MDWTDEECLLLIEMYKARPILWDRTNSQYKMAERKIYYWSEIGKEMNKNVNEVKRKVESLQASYRRERRRVEGSIIRYGAGADEVFHSKWFAFKAMQFLDENFLPRETRDTIDVPVITHVFHQAHQGNEESTKLLHIFWQHLTNLLGLLPDKSQLLEDPTKIVNKTTIDEVLGETSAETEQPQELRKTFVSPQKVASKRKKANDSDRVVIQNLQNVMQDISDIRQAKKQKNDCNIFGEFIASKLELFDDRTKTILQHQISTLIFNAELGFQVPTTN